jgi:hypothetical protein
MAALMLLLLLLLLCFTGSVPVTEFDDPHLHAHWAVDPLLVASHSAKFAGWQMAATLLATDQVNALAKCIALQVAFKCLKWKCSVTLLLKVA